MYLLQFLKGFEGSQNDFVEFEYRLLCSGELYNATILTADWRKSDATRVLITRPFLLFVCSRPFHDYPQELSLRFSAPMVTEVHGISTSMFHPDEEIARDLAALLTLLSRRNITVAAKVREIYPRRHEHEPDFLLDWPVDFINTLTPQFWEQKPASIVYGREGVLDITDYNPPSLGIDPENVRRFFAALGGSKYAEAFILSARLYSLAFQQIERDVDIAYQLLVSSVEATANVFLRAYSPSRDEMISAKKSVLEMALNMGLANEKAEELAIAACSGLGWAMRKFVKFILDNAGDEIWTKDDLFHPPDVLLPAKQHFESTLRLIYEARSGATHSGESFPSSAIIGVGPTVPSKAIMDLDTSNAVFPPVVWFERVVNSTLNRFIQRMVEGDDA